MTSNYAAVLFVFSVLLAAFGQILLKTSANKTYESKIKEYLNPYVISGYSIFVVNTFLAIFCYRWLDLKQGGVLQMFSYVFIMVLGRIFLNEKITKKKVLGMILIMGGIFVFYL